MRPSSFISPPLGVGQIHLLMRAQRGRAAAVKFCYRAAEAPGEVLLFVV